MPCFLLFHGQNIHRKDILKKKTYPVCFLLRQDSPIQKSATPQGLPPPTQQIKSKCKQVELGDQLAHTLTSDKKQLLNYLLTYNYNLDLSNLVYRQIYNTCHIAGILSESPVYQPFQYPGQPRKPLDIQFRKFPQIQEPAGRSLQVGNGIDWFQSLNN